MLDGLHVDPGRPAAIGRAVDARDHQRITRMDEIEDGPQFGTSREGGPAAGLGADHGAACSGERRDLGTLTNNGPKNPGRPSPPFSASHRGRVKSCCSSVFLRQAVEYL